MKRIFNIISFAALGLLLATMSLFSQTTESGIEYGAMATGATVVSPSVERAAFSRFERHLASRGINNPLITKTDLIVEAVLNNSSSSYSMNILKSTGSGDRPLENKLDKNDFFMVMAIGLGLQKSTGANGLNQGQSGISTYPDPAVFAAAGEAAALENIYNGKLHLNVDSQMYLKNMTLHHLRVDPGADYMYGPGLTEEGYDYIDPTPMLDGNVNTEFVLELPKNSDKAAIAHPAAPAENVLRLFLRGYLFSGQVSSGKTACLV